MWKWTISTSNKLCVAKVPWPSCQHTCSALINLRTRYPMGKMSSAQMRRFARSTQPFRVYTRAKFFLWTRRASRILCVMETCTLLSSRQMRKMSVRSRLTPQVTFVPLLMVWNMGSNFRPTLTGEISKHAGLTMVYRSASVQLTIQLRTCLWCP